AERQLRVHLVQRVPAGLAVLVGLEQLGPQAPGLDAETLTGQLAAALVRGQTGRGGMANTELRRGPSKPRAARSASRQPVSSSPSGMSIPTTACRSGASSAARQAPDVTVTAGPVCADDVWAGATSSDTATQPPRHASTPVTHVPLRRSTRARFSPVMSGEATTSLVTE